MPDQTTVDLDALEALHDNQAWYGSRLLALALVTVAAATVVWIVSHGRREFPMRPDWREDDDVVLPAIRARGVLIFESREALERAVQAALDGPWMTWSPEHGDFPSLDPWGDGCVTASAIVARMLAGSEG